MNADLDRNHCLKPVVRAGADPIIRRSLCYYLFNHTIGSSLKRQSGAGLWIRIHLPSWIRIHVHFPSWIIHYWIQERKIEKYRYR